MGALSPQTQVATQASSWWREGCQDRKMRRQTIPQAVSLIRPRLSGELKAKLVVWLLVIRSRMQQLSQGVARSVSNNIMLSFNIRRPHSPIDRVLRVWMEAVVVNSIERVDADTLILLRMLIDLLIHEARNETDYRTIFLFITNRINVHVMRLLQDSDPVLVGEMVFADVVAIGDDGLTVRIV